MDSRFRQPHSHPSTGCLGHHLREQKPVPGVSQHPSSAAAASPSALGVSKAWRLVYPISPMEKLRLREGWDQLGSHGISIMVKVHVHPQNVLVQGVQGSVLESIAGLVLHPWGALPLPRWFSRGLPLPHMLPTMEGEHEATSDPAPQCWEAEGGWQGSGGPSWWAHAPVGSRGEGRHNWGWKCPAGSPPTLSQGSWCTHRPLLC